MPTGDANSRSGKPDDSPAFEEQLDEMRRRLHEVESEHRLSVSDLHASKEHLRLIFENAREYAIFTMDLDRRVTSWNEGARRLLEYVETEIIGTSADVIFTPEDQADGAPVREALTCLRTGRAADERWHMRKDGSRFWGSGSMMVMHDAAGQNVGLLKIMRDRTEERAVLEKLTRAQAEAEAAAEAKDRFFAVLSHELRTPLTPVVSGLEMLLEEDLTPFVREQLQMISRNVATEVRLIDDLLDLTRIARNKLELNLQRIDLHRILEAAVEVCLPDAAKKSQTLNIDLKAPRTAVEGDSLRLQQAVWNLLRNAVKFTPHNGTIRMSSRNAAGAILVEVEDSGCGMDPGALQRIFEAFTQADVSVTRLYGGLGLGLTIARAIVIAHGGSLTGRSEGPGKGATFTITLPLPV